MMLALVVGTADCEPAASAPAGHAVRVACVGEHTTHSNLYLDDREQQLPGEQEYPMKLQALLGPAYEVRNFGDCCSSVTQGYPLSETHPYVTTSNFKNSVDFAPDIVVIGSWGRHDWGLSAKTALPAFTFEKFESGYEDMVKRYLALPTHPKIYCSLPIPILWGQDGPDNGYKTSPAADAIKRVAAKYNLPTIDLYAAFLGHKEFYREAPLKDDEGEHTNDAGMQKIAQMVSDALSKKP